MGEGTGSKTGKLRCAAQATVDALHALMSDEDRNSLALIDLQTVNVFDTTAVIVALSVDWQNDVQRLVGFCLTDKDPIRAASLAVPYRTQCAPAAVGLVRNGRVVTVCHNCRAWQAIRHNEHIVQRRHRCNRVVVG
jgi:hypothetical protein